MLDCAMAFGADPGMRVVFFDTTVHPCPRASILQPDMWGVTPSDRWDWATLHGENIAKHGLRNSLLVAPMPTASTSQILGNNEYATHLVFLSLFLLTSECSHLHRADAANHTRPTSTPVASSPAISPSLTITSCAISRNWAVPPVMKNRIIKDDISKASQGSQRTSSTSTRRCGRSHSARSSIWPRIAAHTSTRASP
jgi:hypothetical protein